MVSFFVLVVGISIILIIFIQITKTKSKTPNNLPLPPGKKGWPLIGETATFVSCPKTFVLNRMRDHSPDVFQTSLVGETMAIFCGPAANKFLFSNEYKYVQSWLPKSIEKALAQPKDWTSNSSKLAKEVSHKFIKPDMIQEYVGIMDCMVKQHLDKSWGCFDQVKVHPVAKEFTFELSCKIFVGLDPSMQQVKELRDPFFEFIEGIISTPINVPGMPYYKALKASKIVQEQVIAIMRQRMKEQNSDVLSQNRDLLSLMLMASDENGSCVSEENIVGMIIGFLFASFYTTSTSITFLVKFLSEHTGVYEKVLQEQLEIKKSKAQGELLNWADVQKMKYSWNVVCETMRITPSSAGSFKEAITDFTYAGFTIPKGWKIHWSPYSTNMNPKYFPDPERFDPSRFEGIGPAPYTFVPFGGGPRMCAGKEYARSETLIFLHNLVNKFKFQMVNPSEKILYNPDPYPVEGLPVYIQRQNQK